MNTPTIQSTSLYFREGNSDKDLPRNVKLFFG